MKALHAAGLTPISVLCDKKIEPKKVSLPLITSPCKSPNLACLKSMHGGLVLLTSVINSGFAKALTYEEALQLQSPENGSDFGSSGALDGAISFVTENPAVLAGGAAFLAVPLVLSQIFKKPKPWGVESAKNAYAKLGEDDNTQLLDIRGPVEFREVGSPDVKSLGKKSVSIVYNGEDKPGFLKKLELKFKDPENTTLFILDKFDGNSELVAELVTVNGFKAAYAIRDGAEGPRGWMSSGLPWTPPRKALSLDFGNLTDAINGALGDGADGLSVAVGIAAATGLGLLAFTEIETVLQLLGSAALVQVVSKKLLFAEDRKQTFQQVNELLDNKVAPKELADDIKQIGKALLPSTANGRALPAPSENSSETPSVDNTVQSVTTSPEQKTEASTAPSPEIKKTEAATAPTPEINSVPKAEVKEESAPSSPRPLSPYASYPDFKPPTSPTPSQP